METAAGLKCNLLKSFMLTSYTGHIEQVQRKSQGKNINYPASFENTYLCQNKYVLLSLISLWLFLEKPYFRFEPSESLLVERKLNFVLFWIETLSL
jgi:hypothetical protein